MIVRFELRCGFEPESPRSTHALANELKRIAQLLNDDKDQPLGPTFRRQIRTFRGDGLLGKLAVLAGDIWDKS